MAGNRSAFEAAMKQAAEHAWNQQWDQALIDYQRAADEFPDDMAARGNLALAYYRLSDWERAASHYSWMLDNAPDNAFIMHRLIEVYLKLERRSEAKKMQARLDALNQRQRDSTGALPAEPSAAHPPAAATTFATSPTDSSRERDRTGALAGPSARPVEGMLTNPLAAFELNEVVALAMAYEESGKITEAVRHYEQAIGAGADRPDIAYSLGLLYQQQGRHQDALNLFSRCLDNADYAMSATYATGVSQRALGHKDDGARMLSLAISLIDHEQVGESEVGELIVIYRTAIEALSDIGNFLQASNLAMSLADLLAPYPVQAAVGATFRDLSLHLQEHLVAPSPSTPDAIVTPPITRPMAPPARTARSARARSVVAPMPDEEAPERLALSYRRVTGNLGSDPRAGSVRAVGDTSGLLGTGSLAGTGQLGGPGRIGGTGRLDSHATISLSAPGTGVLGTHALGSRGTSVLIERPTTLLGTTSLRRRNLHAHDPFMPGVEQQSEEVQSLLAEVTSDAKAGHLLGAIDACRAVAVLAPNFVPVHLRLAELYARRGDPSVALETAQLAVRTLVLRNAEPTDRLSLLRLIVRLRPTDEMALSAYSEAARLAGRSAAGAPLIRRLVRRLLGRGATSRSLTEAEQLAAALPDDLSAQRHLADTLTVLGQPEAAIEIYRRSLVQRKHDLPTIIGANLCFALLSQEPHWWLSLESLVAVARAAKQAPSSPGHISLRLYRKLVGSPIAAHVRLAAGLMLWALGSPAAARTWLDPLLADATADARLRAVAHHATALMAEVDGDTTTEREQRAATVMLLGQPAVAQALADLTLFDQPLTPVSLGLAMVDMFMRQDSLADAIQTLDTLRRLVPGNEVILTQLADLQLQAGRLGAALAALDELACHHRDRGQLEQLAAVLDHMSQLAPNNVGIKAKLIDAYLERGFVEQAQRELELCARLHASNGKIGSALANLQRSADISWAMGRHEEAFAMCGRMIDMQPNNADSRQYLITLYLQTGQIERAVAETKCLADMYLSENNHRDAIAALHQIIGLSPDNPAAYHRLGETLTAVGEFAQAEKVYERLLRLAPDDAVARAKWMAMGALASQAGDTAA